MRRFLAASLPAEGERLILGPGPSHHLLRVTGIAPGEEVEVFDGAGRVARATLAGVEGGRAVLVLGVHRAPPALTASTWLLVGLSRHEAFDGALRMATELGVSVVVPVLAERSVARGERRERWERLVASAAAQCGRADLPELRAPLPLDRALSQVPEAMERRIYLPGAPTRRRAKGACALCLGPEGGFSPDEVELALAAGFQPEGLGPLTLRADTAVAAALARRL